MSGRGSSFECLEHRQLLAAEINVSGNIASVSEQTANGQEISVEVSGSDFVFNSDGPLTGGFGVVDKDNEANRFTLESGSISEVHFHGANGNNVFTVENFAGNSASLNAGGGNDRYELGDDFGQVTVVDSGEGTIDLSSYTGVLSFAQAGGNSIVTGDDGSQVTFDADVGFLVRPTVLETPVAFTQLKDGISELASLGDQFSTFDRMSQALSILNNESLGSFLPIGEIIADSFSQPLDSYLSDPGPDDPDVASLLRTIKGLDGSAYSGAGVLHFSSDATGTMDGDVMTLNIEMSATLTHADTPLGFDNRLLSLDGTLDSLLSTSSLTGELVTGFEWDFSIGIDANAAAFFFADFTDDLNVTADVHVADATFDLQAGLLALGVGAFGPATAPSTIDFDASTTIDASSLNTLDGSVTGVMDGFLKLDEIQYPNREVVLDADPAPLATTDIKLFAEATNVSGITDSTVAEINFDDNEFDAVTPTLTENLTTLEITDFFKLDASSVLQTVDHFGEYLDRLSLKSLENERLLVGQSLTMGDLVDVEGLFREEFLDRIKLPAFTASTALSEVLDSDSGQSVMQFLGTSGDLSPEFSIQLRDKTTFDVNLDGVTTLGDVAIRLTAAGPGATKFEVVTDYRGAYSIIDRTPGATDSDKFVVTPYNDLSSKAYAAATNLGLTAAAEPRDYAGDTVQAIDMAANPGANFVTLQEMLSLPTPTGSAPLTTVGPMSFDATNSTFAFAIDITKTFANASDALLLSNLGSLTDLVTVSTVDFQNPTVTLHFPFELTLSEIGFDTPLSESTPVSELNGGAGITLIEGDDDIQITLADGTVFTVDFDPYLNDRTFADLGVTTSADATAELNVTLRDGTSFAVDLDANLDSTGTPPTNLGEIVVAIQDAADAVATNDGDLDGIALVDSRRGTLRLVDPTAGSGSLTVAGSAAAALGWNQTAVTRNDDGNLSYSIEHSLVTVGEVIETIRDAAQGAGLNLPSDSDFTSSWTFDAYIRGAGIVMVDRTGGTGLTSVAALNESGAHISLGMTTTAISQPTDETARLYDGQSGIVIRTTGSSGPDFMVTLSGGATSFPVDLDTGPAMTTIADVAAKIAAAATSHGITTDQFEVWTDGGNGEISLIDRSEVGAVSSFTIANSPGSFAATDLFGADGSGVSMGFLKNVDFNSPEGDELDGEFVIDLVSSAIVFAGGPLHGDTVAAHMTLAASSDPNVQVDIDLQSSGGTGSGLFGPVAVELTSLAIDAAGSSISTSIDLEPATIAQLWNSLGDPFAYMVGDKPEFTNSLDLSLQLKPVPAVDGVDSSIRTDFAVDIANLYDVRSGDQVVAPVMATDDAVKEFLLATESVDISVVFDYLDSVGDYLRELQSQSRLADNLPGLSKSLGELFSFADAFQDRVQALRDLPEILRPKSLQELNAQLSAPIAGANLAAGLRFDSASQDLLLDLDLALDPITPKVPISLDLTKLGIDRSARDLQKVAAIVDTLGNHPVDVHADGTITIALGIDLSDPSMPSPFLSGVSGSGSATGASFNVRATDDEGVLFSTLLGSLPTEVISGTFVLDSDGSGANTSAAVYTVDLQSDADLQDQAQAIAAASDVSTSVSIAGQMDASFELRLPEQVIPANAPATNPSITVGISNLGDPTDGSSTLETTMDGQTGNWPTFEELSGNFSLADSMNGFKLGFHDLFTKLDKALDTSLLGHELPFVGNQLADAADFLIQMRDSVVDNLSLYGSTLTVEYVRQGLFDAFGPGGFDWLQNDPDTNDFVVNLDDVKVITQTIPANGRDLVIGVEYQMDLVSSPERLAAPVDIDLLLPGLGLDVDATADVLFGFHLPLTVGVSIGDGVYIDVESTNDLEISLDVALPKALARLTGDPRLTFANPTTDAPTITRERGNWILDGYMVGQIIEVTGSDNNDGKYLIGAIDSAGLELTLRSTDAGLSPTDLVNDRVIAEGPRAGIEIEVLEISQIGRPSLVFENVTETQTYTFPNFVDLPPVTRLIDLPDTITRATGSWYDDGFKLGDVITISGSSLNNGEYKIRAIDATGTRVTVEGVLHGETTTESLIRRDRGHALGGHMGVLPFKIEDLSPEQSEMTGTFVIDLLDPSVIAGEQRLSLNDLIAQSPFGNVPQTGFTAAPLPEIMSISELAGHQLTVHPISLLLETDLPTGAAFPPYRMRLDVTNWDWDVNQSLATEIAEPTIVMNDVQFELVGFVRDFLGASITRTSKALEAVDPLMVFLQSEAMPILTLLFGQTSYAQAPGSFGGTSKTGDFAGAVTALRALANGGKPFERDAISEFLSDLFSNNEYDDISLLPIMQLSGEAWIDLGKFDVDGMAARTGSGDVFDPIADVERPLGTLEDVSLRLTGSPDLAFSGSTIDRQNTTVTRNFTFSNVLGLISVTSVGFDTSAFVSGDFLNVFDAGVYSGGYKIIGVDSSSLTLRAQAGHSPSGQLTFNATLVGNVQTFTSAGFVSGQTIRILGGSNAGEYTIASVTDTSLIVTTAFATTETIADGKNIEIAVKNSDGTYSGSILGQIADLSRDRTNSANNAAKSFITTQLLPGYRKTTGIVGLAHGNSVKESYFPADLGADVEPIRLPILEHSFGLLLGETQFDGRSEADSHLLTYSTPELELVLYYMQPLDWEEGIGKLINPLIGKIVGKPLDNAKYAVPFVSIAFEARADYAMAFDTTGLRRFANTGNPNDVVDGFYFDDFEGVDPTPSAIGSANLASTGSADGAAGFGAASSSNRTDEAQVRILGGVGVGAFVDPFRTLAGGKFREFIQARVGFELALFIGQDQNFHDPDGDGRVRANEFDLTSGFSQDFEAGSYGGTGTDAFDKSLRIELRGNVFASVVVGIFLTQKRPPFGLKFSFTVFSARINLFTIGVNLHNPFGTDSVVRPALGTQSGDVLDLNFQPGDNVLYVGAQSAIDDQGRQDITVSATNYSETYLAVASITGIAGMGDDFIFVHSNVSIPATIDGGGGNDTIFGGSANDRLSGGSGNDYLVGGFGADIIHGDADDDWVFGSDGNDQLFGGGGRDVIRGYRDDDQIDGGDGDDLIAGDGGADTVDGGSGMDIILGGIGRDILRGGAHDDRIEGGRDADAIYGDDDADLLLGGLGNDTLEGGSGDDDLFGERHNDSLSGDAGDDRLDGGYGSDKVDGGLGDDLIVSLAGNDTLDGEEGDDTFKVFFENGKSQSFVLINDSGSDNDTDVFAAIGTLQDDQFLLRASVSGSNAFVALLSDPDHAPSDPAYDPAVQRINYLGVERITVSGGLGNDRFAVDDTAAEVTLNGDAGEDEFQIGQLFRSERTFVNANVSVADVFATIETTRGFLSNGISAPMTVNGGLGDDRFVVFHNKAVLSLNGDEGDDNFEVRAFALIGSREPERARTDITGGAGADLVQYAVNAPVIINGGDGFDTLTVIGTEFGDDFVITNRGVFGAGLTIDFTNIESLRVDGAEGDDRFFVQSTSEKFLTELFGGLGEDTFNMSGDTPPVVSNDLRGHSGIVTNGVRFSDDFRYEDLKLHGVSSNVADNEEPYIVIRTSGGSSIISESSASDPSLMDHYQVVLSRPPLLGFDVLVKALAPLPSSDRRDLGAMAFRLSSPAPLADEKEDGSVVTLRFTADNWHIPQLVEIRADGETKTDTGRLFTRPDLGESVMFEYNDDAYEGIQSSVINHLVVSSAATVDGSPVDVKSDPTLTISTDRPFYEFVGENITVTSSDGATVQHRRIIAAKLVDGDMQLTMDRSWLAGGQVPDSTSTFSIDLDDGPFNGTALSAVNSIVTVTDPLDPLNPFLDDVNDLLGRQVTIVDGFGIGQSRFITGADATISFTGSIGNVSSPHVASFSLDMTEGSQGVTLTSGGVLNVLVNADLNTTMETLAVHINGTLIDVLFDDSTGRQYSPVHASIPINQATLQSLVNDGQIDLSFTPSLHVGDFGTSSLSFDLQFTADASSATFNKGILGDLNLTMDRGWDVAAVPDANSRFQIRVDDSLIGKTTEFNESPSGLPADPSFPAELDTRTTFSNDQANFTDSQFGSEGLRGATLEIVGGPGAGQQRVILGTLDSQTLILNGGWRTDPVAGESLYRIARFDGLAVSSVGVETNDDDQAGLIVDETQGFDSSAAQSVTADFDTVTAVIEGGDGDHLGERDVVRVKLSRQPVAAVNVELLFDGIQLSIEDVSGASIPGNTLIFDSTNWNDYRDVVVSASHDLIREGFHTNQIKWAVTSSDVDAVLTITDQFDIPLSQPVELVGLSQRPTQITSVTYNGQSLDPYDPLVPAGTDAKPVWQLNGNKVVFRNRTNITTVLGSDLRIQYQYENPGYHETFVQPLFVRTSDADAPTVLVRETDGSTDVVEGAASFTRIEFTGTALPENGLINRTVTIASGAGAGQSATVMGNTATSLTIDRAWAITPDNTSKLSLSNDVVSGSSLPQTFSGTVSYPRELNRHSVHLVAGTSYLFSLEGAATAKGTLSDPVLWLVDDGRGVVQYNDDGGIGRNSRIHVTASKTGNYTLIASGYFFYTGSYQLTADFASDIPSWINTPARLPMTGSLRSNLYTTGDQDWFRVEMSVGNQYTFHLEGAPSGQGTLADPLLRVVDHLGFEVDINDNIDDANNLNSQITFNPLTSGTYFVSAQGAGTGTYRLTGSTIPATLDIESVSLQTLAEDHYELVLTAAPDNGVGGGTVEVTVTPEITKTSRTGGIRTDAKQVEIYNLDRLPDSRVRVDPNNPDNLIVTFDATNWDAPIRIGVRAIDDDKVDGGDTKVFANGPNTLSEILGPVTVDGAGGEGSLVGIGPPEKLPYETNIKEKTGEVASVDDLEVTLETLTTDELLGLGLATDLSNLNELVGRTIEVVATHPTAEWLAVYPDATVGSTKDPLVGQFRLIESVRVEDANLVITMNARFGADAADDARVKSYAITMESLNFFVDESQSVDYLFVHDEDSPADSTGHLTGSRLWGLNMGPDVTIGNRLRAGGITFGNLEVMQIDLGRGNNDFNVLGTHARADDPTTTADETFQTWTIINGGDDVFWPVTGRQGDIVSVHLDAADVTDVVTGTVTAGQQPSQTEFAGLQDSTSPFGAANALAGYQITSTTAGGTVQTRTILGNTADTVWIDGVWAEQPANGDTYAITNLADGALSIDLQEGDDRIDATRSTKGFVAIGGLGQDTLLGGSGEDILIGDQGRVDYFGGVDDAGHRGIVTRLGTTPSPISGTVTTGFADDGNLIDENATFPIADGFDNGLRGTYVDINNGTGFLQTPRLVIDNDATSLTIAPDFTETLDTTSSYRISTFPEDQTDGVVRGANLVVSVNDLDGDVDVIMGGAGDDQIIGGAGDDDLNGGEDNDIILGDTGSIDRAALPANASGTRVDSLVDLVRTKTPEAGGEDLISGDDGDDIIFGGFGTDFINFDRNSVQLVGESGNDLIVGDGGIADFDTTSGAAILIQVESNEPTFGSTDYITAGDGEKIIIGGAGDDQLLAGTDNEPDIVIGDEGVATFDSITGLRTRVATTTSMVGGSDTIAGGDALNLLLGGSGGDSITGGDTQDVVIGDNGEITFDADGNRLLFRSIDPTLGGQDSIFGNDGNDILIGGTDNDAIQGGPAHDVILGDHGEVDFTRPVDRNVISRSIEATDGGGNDTIDGNDGDDFVWGGQGDDTILGGSGQDDLVGGHNVPFGSDGNDYIDGGDDEDVILGDNGLIRRELLTPELGTWTNYLSPFDSIVVREPQPFDDRDLIAGDDVILGSGGMDILRGQRGNDEIFGGEHDDEIIGGLGSDEIHGDAGNDFILADAGQILRDLNSDGTPQLNQDGVTWHRDLLTEKIARVIDIVPTSSAGLINAPSDLSDRLLDADQIVLASIHLPSGAFDLDAGGMSQTVALLLDLVDADDDIVAGGDGNDIVLGQRGNDLINGGDGDDTLVGDHGVHVAPMETDVPQMIDGIRLISTIDGYDALSGIQLDLPGFGKVIVPDFVAEPGELVAERPRWDRVTPVNSELAAIANDDQLKTVDDQRLSTAILITPHFIGHVDVVSGNDSIAGAAGSDLIIGDDWIIQSDLNTGIAPVNEALDAATGAVAGLMHAFESMILDREVVRHEIDGIAISDPILLINHDNLTGGDDDDTIVGDSVTFELPSTQTVPGTGTPSENAAAFQEYLYHLRSIADDAMGLVSRAHLDVIDRLLDDAKSKRPSLPAISGSSVQFVNHHHLIFGQDTLAGDDGDDHVLGGDAVLVAPFVTGSAGDFPDSAGAVGFDADSLETLEQNLFEEANRYEERLRVRRSARLVNVADELSRRTPLNRIEYVPSIDRSLDNDEILGGNGNDFLAGDFTVIATPLIQTSPMSSIEARDLDNHVETLLDQISNGDRNQVPDSFERQIGRSALAASTTDSMSPESRHNAIDGTWTIGEDLIDGGSGDDVVLGDHAVIVSAVLVDQPGQYESLRRSNYEIRYRDDSMKKFLESSALDQVDVELRADRIVGGTGNDVLMGSVGTDRIDGNDGDDAILGGNERDILRGDAGNNTLRDDGGNYPRLDLKESMGTSRFATTTSTTAQLLRDAAAGATMPVSWSAGIGGLGTDPGDGDPDNPTPRDPRAVTIDGDRSAVIGQPVTLTGTFTDLPAGASTRLLWEVVDEGGTIIEVGAGEQFVFVPGTSGTYTVNLATTDNANGAGTQSATLTIVETSRRMDPDAPGMFILTIGGTSDGDNIRLLDVRRQPHSVEVRQRIGRNQQNRVSYTDISRIEIYGGDGDDDIAVDRQLTIPVRLYGGAGDDRLRGGAANDYLEGGAGNDRIYGEGGNDVLVGGFGNDRIDGGKQDDLMIADDLQGIGADSLLAKWSNSSDSAADRMADLITDLTDAITADGADDKSDGDRGNDWYFSQLTDEIHRRRGDVDLVTSY